MAEKGILIKPQSGGVSVAARDAVQQDDGANDRIVSLVDVAARPVTFGSTPLRTVTASDPVLLGTLPTGISGNTIDVSDASSVVITAKVTTTDSDSLAERVIVVPVVIEAGAAVALLTPIILRGISVYPGDDPRTSQISLTNLSNTMEHLTMAVAVPTLGVTTLGFAVYSTAGVNTGFIDVIQVDLFAAPTSFGGRDSGLEADIWQTGVLGDGKFRGHDGGGE